MKPIKDILVSRNFMREVSLLLFVFAAFSFLFSIFLFTFAGSDWNAIAASVGALIQGVIYLVLAILVRRGSVKALWCTGILFVLDTVLILLGPSGQAVGGMMVSRTLLIVALVGYVRRERKVGTPKNQVYTDQSE